MKKALIITYYFPPCHGSAPWRPYSWAKYFKNYGIAPTVITRHWKGNEHSWEDYIKDIDDPPVHKVYNDYDVHFLPSSKSNWYKILMAENWISKFCKPIFLYLLQYYGHIGLEVDAYHSFRKFLSLHLKRNSYDYVIFTLPPPNLLRLSRYFKSMPNVKLIADFRDIWDNRLTAPSYSPSLIQMLNNFLSLRFYKKHLKRMQLITCVTPSFLPVLSTISSYKTVVVYNGYEGEYFENKKRQRNDRFTFSIIGSLYPQQDISIMLEGLQVFLKNKQPEKVCLKFIGLEMDKNATDKIMSALPAEFVILSPRLPKEEAIKETIQSDVLFYPAWKGYKGILGVKPLDYIASGNKILLAPGDDDILDTLITQTATGSIANTVEEFVSVLEAWYSEWQLNGSIACNAQSELVSFYSRHNQAAILAKELLKL